MSEISIVDFEDRINDAKKEFSQALQSLLQLISAGPTLQEVSAGVTSLHTKATAFFNLFERSVNEYGLEYYKINEDKRQAKINDALPVSQTITDYWKLLRNIKNQYNILIPTPTKKAYSSIQGLLQIAATPEQIKEFKQAFENAGLPIDGFNDKPPSIMTKKTQITYATIAGTIFLLILLGIALFNECPTEAQARIFNVTLALAAAAFAAVIPGFINIKYREMITAGGALGVFVMVFLWKPADLTDIKNCQKHLSGTVFYGNTPLADADINLIRQNQSTRTNRSGNFTLPVDFSSIGDEITIMITQADVRLDTIFSLKKSDVKETFDIMIKKYCTTCAHTNDANDLIREASECSASKKYIQNYIRGFTRAGNEQSLQTDCKQYTQP